jgi:hypothetical protein
MNRKDFKDLATYSVMWRPNAQKLIAKGIDPKRLYRNLNLIGVSVIAFQLAVIFGPAVVYKIQNMVEKRKQSTEGIY